MPLYNPPQLTVNPVTSGTATASTVAVPANIANAAILAAVNSSRKGLTLQNNSTGNVLIELGAAPTASTYLTKIIPGGYYELPYNYTGQVQALWDAAGGTGVLVREFT